MLVSYHSTIFDKLLYVINEGHVAYNLWLYSECLAESRGVDAPSKPIMHIAYSLYFHKIYKFSSLFLQILKISHNFCLIYIVFA